MTDYVTKDLYGGAITVSLPKDYVNASDLRQIPDHQEVFLSTKTLTNLIFEINQYVKQPSDTAAVHFHFTDVIAEPDTVAGTLEEPTKVNMANASMKDFTAYALQGGIISPEIDKNAALSLPVEWQQNPQMKELATMVYQLVVRMEKYGTDLCVRLNVPMKEMKNQEEVEKEEGFAKQMIGKIVGSLEVKDFALFGTE